MISSYKAAQYTEKVKPDQLTVVYHNNFSSGANTNTSLSWLSLSKSDKKILVEKINSLEDYSRQPPLGSFTNIVNKIREIQGRIEILY